MISNKGLVTISSFMSSCDDLVSGKFIFATNKVANILKAINESPELYEVISECLKNFNYEKEIGRAKVKLPTKKGTFKMPEDNTVIIPLVFCMLVEIQDGKIDLKQFLADYFDSDDGSSQFENFANEVIVPFKNAIAYLFDIEGTNKFKPETKQDKKEQPKSTSSKTEGYFKELCEICVDITSDLAYSKAKEEISADITYLVDMIKCAIEKKDVKMTNGLVMGLCYVLKQVRRLRFYEGRLRDAMETMYL